MATKQSKKLAPRVNCTSWRLDTHLWMLEEDMGKAVLAIDALRFFCLECAAAGFGLRGVAAKILGQLLE